MSVGGTQGAHSPPTFSYSADERAAIVLAAGQHDGIIEWLERLANEYLATPTTQERYLDAASEERSNRRINAATAELLAALEDGGYCAPESPANSSSLHEDQDDLVSQLFNLLAWTEHAAVAARQNIPHRNSNWSWKHYLFTVCDFWRAKLGQKVARRRTKTGEIVGPMVGYIVAVAGPVKMLRAPENLTGPMTAEMAGHAITAYKRDALSEAADAARNAIIAAALRETP